MSNMSEEDRDVEVESYAGKKVHHNAQERERRDHIKTSFYNLRDSVPSLQVDELTISRAQILKKAADYIQFMRTKNYGRQKDIDDLKRQNVYLEKQILACEKVKLSRSLRALHSTGVATINVPDYDADDSESDENSNPGRCKRLKTSV